MKKTQTNITIWIPLFAAFIAGIFLLTGNWQKHWLEDPTKTKAVPAVEPTVKNEIGIVDNDISGGTPIGKIEGTVVINNYSAPLNGRNEPKLPPTLHKSFRLIAPHDFENIVEVLRKTGQVTYDNQSQLNVFEITYTGKLEKGGEPDLYLYRGGYLLINKDGQTCKIMEDIKFPSFDYPTNPRARLEEMINQQLKFLAQQNADQIAKEIVKCML